MNRVRRLVTVTENNLSAITGLTFEMDCTVGSSLYQDSALTTLAGPGTVLGGVVDLSRNANTATQTTTSAKPTLTANAINGRQAASFDGGDWLAVDSLAASVSGSDMPFSLAAVVQQTNVAALRCLFSITRSTGANPYGALQANGSAAYICGRRDDSGAAVSPTGGVPNTAAHIFLWLFSGTTVSLLRDGVTLVDEAAQNVGTLTLDLATIGAQRLAGTASQQVIGTIGALAFWPIRISTPEALWATRLLGQKWGIVTA